MFTHDGITFQMAQDRRREMVAAAERARLARQARSLAPTPRHPQSRRRARQPIRRLRPQAQS